MYYITAGIDGCKSGWLMVKHSEEGYAFGVYSNIQDLVIEHTDIQRVLIDIPLGLSGASFKRTIDARLKKELGVRHSTVFMSPCREAVYADDYETAKAKNKRIEGKSISIQAFHISSKIREVDTFITSGRHSVQIIESHPEFCFKHLNNKNILLSNKKSLEGEQERLNILSKYDAELVDVYQKIRQATLRKAVANDDIIDALCLVLVNQLAGKLGLQILADDNRVDECGVHIGIGYCNAALPVCAA